MATRLASACLAASGIRPISAIAALESPSLAWYSARSARIPYSVGGPSDLNGHAAGQRLSRSFRNPADLSHRRPGIPQSRLVFGQIGTNSVLGRGDFQTLFGEFYCPAQRRRSEEPGSGNPFVVNAQIATLCKMVGRS